MEKRLLARWESKSGKWFVELYVDALGATYKGVDCGGNLGLLDESTAIAEMQRRVDSGYFQPDANTSPMKRIR